MSFDLTKWFEKYTEEKTIFSYLGEINEQSITDILDNIEERLSKRGESIKISKRVYYISVESLQNLFHHADGPLTENNGSATQNKVAFILSEKVNDRYLITTGNFIKKKKRYP